MNNLDLAVIGNCNVSALVNTMGTIVWFCSPRLDSDPVFCSLMRNYPDTPDNKGSLQIELDNFDHAEQTYLRNTAIVVTTLHDKDDNVVEVTDFCPRFKHYGRMFRPNMIVRKIKPIKGYPRIKVRASLMQNYGESERDHTLGSNHIRYPGGDVSLRLTTNLSFTNILEERPFVLTRSYSMIIGPDETLRDSVHHVSSRFLRETENYWVNWVRYLAIPFEWQEEVIRSAITLKLSAYEDTGGIIAAQTTSLPEAEGSVRNWDYRFCWLRDSYFTVNALNRLGATQTMEHYLEYIINIAARLNGNHLQPVFGINGEEKIDEWTVEHLEGFLGCRPVRVGNQAYTQIQHDVYGAVVLSVAQLFFDKRTVQPGDDNLFRQLERVGNAAVRYFAEPDAGLWELRGSQHIHTFSCLMCWAAADRLAKIAGHLEIEDRHRYWSEQASEMHQRMCEEAWSDDRNAFAATFGGDSMDASLLLMHELGFLAADDPRFIGTVNAIEEDLRKGDYIFRYVTPDDFGEPEHAFTVCTFWYIDALASIGRVEEARELFENLLRHTNHLGLMAEHIEVATGEMWGNFPQTYSMVGIIHSAMKLSHSWEEAF